MNRLIVLCGLGLVMMFSSAAELPAGSHWATAGGGGRFLPVPSRLATRRTGANSLLAVLSRAMACASARFRRVPAGAVSASRAAS